MLTSPPSPGGAVAVSRETERVLLGFWRGQRLREVEPRLRPGGKYEMATLELRSGDRIAPAKVRPRSTRTK